MSQERLTLTNAEISQQAHALMGEIERHYQKLTFLIKEPCSAGEMSHIKDTHSRIRQISAIIEKRFGK